MGREPEESRETAAAVPSASHASSVQDVPNIPPHGDIVSLMSRTLGAANRYLVELMAREGLAGIVPSHGDILMQLDSTDVDLDIAKTQAQIAQLDAQIQSMEGTIAIGFV